MHLYARSNPINRTDPSGLYSQKQITQMFHASSYMNAIQTFRSHVLFSGRWGFLEVLHRADNRDRIEFYTFSPNGNCGKSSWGSPQPQISMPFLEIGNLRHTLSNVEKGRLFWTGHYLWLMDDSGKSTPIWDNVWQADYVILQNEFGAEKFSTFMNSQYPSLKLIWDEVDWISFWENIGSLAAVGLIITGAYLTAPLSAIALAIGVPAEMFFLFYDVIVFFIEGVIPIIGEMIAGNDPTSEQVRKFNNGLRLVSEETIEEILAKFSNLSRFPLFDLAYLSKNIAGAVKYTP